MSQGKHGRGAAWAALDAINARFYEEAAVEFSSTRGRPWPGWRRIVEFAERRLPENLRPWKVLDVACGNGRLLQSLSPEAVPGGPWSYVGAERSLHLLAAAKGNAERSNSPVASSFVAADTVSALADRTFDLVCAFGLLHHIPGHEQRVQLLRALMQRVAPHGLLAVSFWQFHRVPAIAQRAIPPEDLIKSGLIDRALLDSLEEGDAFLPWGPRHEHTAPKLRYCHTFRDEEIKGLLVDAFGAGAAQAQRFHSDGRNQVLNAYAVLERVATR